VERQIVCGLCELDDRAYQKTKQTLNNSIDMYCRGAVANLSVLSNSPLKRKDLL
jgi:hypothetical protein